MEYRSKTSSGHQATQPLKLSRFENQQSKPSSSKPKPTCNTLFKQQILKDR